MTETDDNRKPKLKRRWLRFSLKTFFVVVAINCVWLAWFVYRVEQQKSAVRWVKDQGGSVLYNYEFTSSDGYVYTSGPPNDLWANSLDEDYLSPVVYIQLGETETNNLRPLKSLKSLKHLDLAETYVTDLTSLRSMSNLRILDLQGNALNISKSEIEELQKALPKCDIYHDYDD